MLSENPYLQPQSFEQQANSSNGRRIVSNLTQKIQKSSDAEKQQHQKSQQQSKHLIANQILNSNRHGHHPNHLSQDFHYNGANGLKPFNSQNHQGHSPDHSKSINSDNILSHRVSQQHYGDQYATN